MCTGLPEDWTEVKTETKFPVNTGTTITVSCQEGYINTGSSAVTCNTYLHQDFEFARKPQCFKSGNVWKEISSFNSSILLFVLSNLLFYYYHENFLLTLKYSLFSDIDLECPVPR